MRVHFKPKTKLGKWSAWLIVSFFVVGGIGLGIMLSIWSPLSVGERFLHILYSITVGNSGAPFGAAAFITGLISIVRRKERSIAVYLAVTFGSFGFF
jgi:hypothetical protein